MQPLRALARAQAARPGALLAVDPGARYVGLAICTAPQLFGATPYGLIERQPSARWKVRHSAAFRGQHAVPWFESQTDALVHIVREQNVSGVVYGMAYHADGSVSRECHLAERAAASLREAAGPLVPVLLWDESYTTREAVGHGRPPRARDAVWSHAAAACILLQEVLEAMRAQQAHDRRR